MAAGAASGVSIRRVRFYAAGELPWTGSRKLRASLMPSSPRRREKLHDNVPGQAASKIRCGDAWRRSMLAAAAAKKRKATA